MKAHRWTQLGLLGASLSLVSMTLFEPRTSLPAASLELHMPTKVIQKSDEPLSDLEIFAVQDQPPKQTITRMYS